MKKVKPETIARTICLLIALVNQVLAFMGKNIITFTDDQVYQLVSIICTIITSVWAWWKNNSFTENAREADKYLDKLKEGNYLDD